MNRRNFVKQVAGLSALAPISSLLPAFSNLSKKKMRLLVLGGTNFLGPAIVNAALKHRCEVTLFNRGITNPELFPNLSKIKGDRTRGKPGYANLPQTEWDVVIDVWPEHAKLVDEATQLLQNQTAHYIFVSSIAVYLDFNEVGLNESSKVVSLPKDKEQWYYPEEKVAAENMVRDRFPKSHTIVRPGPIKGWRDSGLDLAYWVAKIKQGGEILAPGSGLDPVQFIDAKDIGKFLVNCMAEKHFGTFNTTGPRATPLLWQEFLEIIKKSVNPKAKLTWVSEAFLAENKVRSFVDIPLWAPLSEDRGFMQISSQKAIEAGIKYRPVKKTLRDVLSWFELQHGSSYPFGRSEDSIGLSRERELALLKSWR